MRWNVSKRKSRFLTIEALFYDLKCSIFTGRTFWTGAVIVIAAVETVFVKGGTFTVFNQTEEDSFFGIDNGAMNLNRVIS